MTAKRKDVRRHRQQIALHYRLGLVTKLTDYAIGGIILWGIQFYLTIRNTEPFDPHQVKYLLFIVAMGLTTLCPLHMLTKLMIADLPPHSIFHHMIALWVITITYFAGLVWLSPNVWFTSRGAFWADWVVILFCCTAFALTLGGVSRLLKLFFDNGPKSEHLVACLTMLAKLLAGLKDIFK